MLKKLRVPFGVVMASVALGGCSGLTDPRLITNFDWGEVEEPEAIVEGISTTVALGDLFVLGQFNTPSHCYDLEADFRRRKSKLTIHVKAGSTNSPNCDQSLGGFRYTAQLINLKFGTYELRVVHDITGGSGGEFTEMVTIR